MIGYPTVVFETSSTSGFHELWSCTESTDSAITLVFRLSHSSLSWPTRPSSVVHTGVESAGWLKKTAQLLPFQSRNEISPSVVGAVKSGALSPRCREAMDSLQSVRARVVPVHRQYPGVPGAARCDSWFTGRDSTNQG